MPKANIQPLICTQCSAPLDYKEVSGIIVCRYCGTAFYVNKKQELEGEVSYTIPDYSQISGDENICLNEPYHCPQAGSIFLFVI